MAKINDYNFDSITKKNRNNNVEKNIEVGEPGDSVNKFKIKKNVQQKVVIKAYSIRLKEVTVSKLDKLSKKAGLSRNEFISQLLDLAADNTEITD